MPEAGANLTNAYRGARVLVTGGAGFIGSHLVQRLAGLGAEVRIIDDLSTGSRANIAGSGAEFVEASILDEESLRSAIAGCRYVYHEAAMVSVPLSVEEPVRCMAINLTGTERVLEAARGAGVERVVFASSSAVYGGEPNLPSREQDPVDCRSPYAASKAAGEAVVAAFGRCYEFSTVSLRYFNIFGPRQDPNSPYAAVIAAFIDALSAGRRPTVFGDGLQTRDFTSIENVVHANLLAGACPGPLRGETINIGTGQQTSLLDLLAALNPLLGRNEEPVFAPARAGDVEHSVADIGLAAELIGYEPMVDFETGIANTINAAPPADPAPGH